MVWFLKSSTNTLLYSCENKEDVNAEIKHNISNIFFFLLATGLSPWLKAFVHNLITTRRHCNSILLTKIAFYLIAFFCCEYFVIDDDFRYVAVKAATS